MLNTTEAVGVMPPEKASRSELNDTQSERDFRAIPINKVGVRGVKFPISVRDKGEQLQNTVATMGLFVNLPKDAKGTHMSRFLEILQDRGRRIEVAQVPSLLREVRQRLNAEDAYLEMEFPFFNDKAAPVTGKFGIMNYTARIEASLKSGTVDVKQAIRVPVTTLCPCSKTISLYGAHNQRGEVTIEVRAEAPLWFEELIRIAETSASSEVYSLLKREDEKAVTEEAYENPVFVEDLVRNVAQELNLKDNVAWYKVEAENYESIHHHNAYACVVSQ